LSEGDVRKVNGFDAQDVIGKESDGCRYYEGVDDGDDIQPDSDRKGRECISFEPQADGEGRG